MLTVADIPARQIPTMRYHLALEAGIKQIMATTWGGLGDQVCAEPTLRYMFKLFPDYEISLLTSFPELFTHLPFKQVYPKSQMDTLKDDEWLVLHTNVSSRNMVRDFLVHHFTHPVDFSSQCAIQRQLPIASREITLPGSGFYGHNQSIKVVVHPGRHWPSKTFPKAWWDRVLALLAEYYHGEIAVVGQDVDENIGTVDVTIPPGVFDFRNQLKLQDLVSLCAGTRVVLTNDSAPLHIAAAGDAHILFVASCKEPDYLYHWRRGGFAWRMTNLGRDGLWNHQSSAPIRHEPLRIDLIPDGLMERILPHPEAVLRAAMGVC